MKFSAFASLIFVASSLLALPSLANSDAAGLEIEARELASAIEFEFDARAEAADRLGLAKRDLAELEEDLYARYLNHLENDLTDFGHSISGGVVGASDAIADEGRKVEDGAHRIHKEMEDY